jgi:hypothetical protein
MQLYSQTLVPAKKIDLNESQMVSRVPTKTTDLSASTFRSKLGTCTLINGTSQKGIRALCPSEVITSESGMADAEFPYYDNFLEFGPGISVVDEGASDFWHVACRSTKNNFNSTGNYGMRMTAAFCFLQWPVDMPPLVYVFALDQTTKKTSIVNQAVFN